MTSAIRKYLWFEMKDNLANPAMSQQYRSTGGRFSYVGNKSRPDVRVVATLFGTHVKPSSVELWICAKSAVKPAWYIKDKTAIMFEKLKPT